MPLAWVTVHEGNSEPHFRPMPIELEATAVTHEGEAIFPEVTYGGFTIDNIKVWADPELEIMLARMDLDTVHISVGDVLHCNVKIDLEGDLQFLQKKERISPLLPEEMLNFWDHLKS